MLLRIRVRLNKYKRLGPILQLNLQYEQSFMFDRMERVWRAMMDSQIKPTSSNYFQELTTKPASFEGFVQKVPNLESRFFVDQSLAVESRNCVDIFCRLPCWFNIIFNFVFDLTVHVNSH